MHCSRCGSNISGELNFCSSCGERVNKNAAVEGFQAKGKIHDNLSTVAIFIGCAGPLFLVGLVAVLLDKSLPVEAIIAMVGMYIAAWLFVMIRLIRPLTQMMDIDSSKDPQKEAGAESESVFVPAKQPRSLTEYREPASVTDATTRALEDAPIKRR